MKTRSTHDLPEDRRPARARSDSKYALVIAAARRTRQINDYHGQLGEGSFESFAPPLVESRSKNFLTMALEEIAAGQLKVTMPTKASLKK